MIKPLNRRTLYEAVIEEIIELIKNKQWKPEDKIPGEIELSKRFEVSRNCIREALKALEHSKIIFSKAGHGTFVTANAHQNIYAMELAGLLRQGNTLSELLETRLIIEPQLTYIAAEKANEADIKKLENIIKKSKETISSGSYDTIIGYEFHMAIAEISNNTLLIKFLESINEELNAQRKLLLIKHLTEQDLIREIKEHEEIKDLIKSRSPRKAEEKMRKHIIVAKGILKRADSDKMITS
ncbi:FadR/GntR family transcriptional regulator [Fictibacillus fluitans]|uniref:FadR/GntR family transcriptional regulator n=1 Tax=Fictibacillus fluitans TaxID=3058422 RepID=A0ABT8HRH3_9BACL|nr:FadR/GntR family transcriptional regulator [Fictibacillus sp. NE201]MDN4523360.1 FadR/GntR family transcriptional regulator [Fictibacillus sp. NE201]